MDGRSCQSCAYYRQHYTFDHRKIFRVYCGHCTHQKNKAKRPDTKACESYSLSESAENSFVSKEYLSKAMLEYLFRLELLPEICDTDEE